MHCLRYVIKCTVTDLPFNTEASCSKCPLSACIHVLTQVTRKLVTLWSTAALLMPLAVLRIRWSSSLVFTLHAYTIVSCNHTHGNLMGSDPLTMVANSVYCHDQSISLGIHYSDTAWWPNRNKAALCHAGSTSVVVLVEEHSLRVLAVHLAKSWCKYYLSDVVGKCMDQSVGHQWHHTTLLQQRDVGSCLWQFHVDYHDPINGSFLYYWLHRG